MAISSNATLGLLKSVHSSIECTEKQKCYRLLCATQRVYSKRDLFKTLTSMNIARDHHNRIIYRFVEL